ncbi:unnamed protein product [Hermetia illucens]|uniref:V-type proton ATPase subunit a n=2 Tax=Hermetia illucens TaxID=343691 RepID=A0A7R8YUH4_HERIL|nr:V-type proton ATPase 116 kDa subunit a1-like isoform X2 [Hermetia illucens]XP_037909788.1 V-type proton ATPase 116 kDa subunit a1-like isoform X2 [Hermetia illucens]XP_037909789.1 V-type proton ATPase 116 kDa subunit a1-like isoform X2 [Hermetia illucens]XP_037909790.1 V-type proton ATPase 116 kDa subunit a1-like isoform X2 [Hermetia illucens]CAD7084736.1 unnamed protein product [Hermetia illucens]
MGSMFRSEAMALCQMFIQPEAAYTTVSELGESGTVQFRDMNDELAASQRKFVQEVRRCDEMERKLRYIESKLLKEEVAIPEMTGDIPRAPNPREMIDIEAHLEKVENEILELSQNEINLKSNFVELSEMRKVLESTQGFFSDDEVLNLDARRSIPNEGLIPKGTKANVPLGQRNSLGFVAGVIKRERVFAFERMLWRISRGNVFLKTADISEPTKDPVTGHKVFKVVFVAFFQGDQLKDRIKKICTGFHASLYPCPSAHSEREEMIKGVSTRLEDLKIVLNQTDDHCRRVLVSVSRELPKWNIMVKKMKAIYHTMNFFNMDVSKKCMIGECWVPVNDLPSVQTALVNGSAEVGSTVPSFLNIISTSEQPPTFIRTNKFTRGFQNLIDSYGVATYREVNPGLYTIVTFPFLFGVMFGDLGHGFIMFLFALVMVLKEKTIAAQKKGEIARIFFSGRYIILLMGLFAMYTGFLYNDIFSISMNVFGSGWRVNLDNATVMGNAQLTLNPTTDALVNIYPMGIDPIWQLATNKIIFSNSFKMKLSIILGVIHMVFGVCMSVVNHINFRKPAYIALEFLPQIIFLLLMFGWMMTLMIMKWIMFNARVDTPQKFREGCAPSILITFINMVLFKEETPLPGCNTYIFEGQDILQIVFVIASLVCIPWLLFGKPIFKIMTRTRHHGEILALPSTDMTESTDLDSPEDAPNGEAPSPVPTEPIVANKAHHEEEPFGEIFILQAIHTIEYVLSTVSHTASYLRLWALSLAHAELSEVLWGQLFRISLTIPSYVGAPAIFLLFMVWSGLTISIMVMMEGLSAFLHTLRLHWVEFMSKFYAGEGYAFIPFSFKAMLESDEDEDA